MLASLFVLPLLGAVIVDGDVTCPTPAAVSERLRPLLPPDEGAGPVSPPALRGRAVCHLRAGADTEAQRDLHDYLARFPGGPFAGEAERRLRR